VVVSLRWRIAFILSIAIAISYLDRQALSVAVAAIQQDIPLSIPTDLFPRSIVASVAGLVGFGGAMGGIVSNLIGDDCSISAWVTAWCSRSSARSTCSRSS
jgi:ACS family hexuronate transporter-like MFS transporter